MEQPQTDNKSELQAGAYAGLQGYPRKITFKMEEPVLVTFPIDYSEPMEMPSTDGQGVYYIFEVFDGNGDKASVTTSAVTLLNNLKSHEPLASKSLVITKKSVKGKTLYYVNRPDGYGTPEVKSVEPEEVDTEEAGIAEDKTV